MDVEALVSQLLVVTTDEEREEVIGSLIEACLNDDEKRVRL